MEPTQTTLNIMTDSFLCFFFGEVWSISPGLSIYNMNRFYRNIVFIIKPVTKYSQAKKV